MDGGNEIHMLLLFKHKKHDTLETFGVSQLASKIKNESNDKKYVHQLLTFPFLPCGWCDDDDGDHRPGARTTTGLVASRTLRK